MKVRAKKAGFIHGVYRYPGSVFELKGDKFSDKWMEKVSDETPIVMTEPAPPSPEDALRGSPLLTVKQPKVPLEQLESYSEKNGSETEAQPSGDKDVI